VVNVKLANVDWDEATLLAGVLLVDCVWVLVLNNVTFVDFPAPVPAGDGIVLVSEFKFGITTD
jgi:hypothetical protein